MWLTDAPATFIQTINNMLDSRIAVFLDDISFSHKVKEYFTLLEKALVYLYQFIFYCKIKKFRLLHNSTIFLGFNITPKGMHMCDSKVQSLNEWPVPTMVN